MTKHTDEGTLIGRVASNEADALEWDRLEEIASRSPDIWRRIACSLRDELQMRCALEDALAEADSVEIPTEAFDRSRVAATPDRAVTRWSGWAIAALLALAWVGTSFFTSNDIAGRNSIAGAIPQAPQADGDTAITQAGYTDPDEAYRDYLRLGAKEGRILQELPMVMIETRRVVKGGEGQQPVYEVFYVRQLLERTRVRHAFEINRDEFGRPVPVAIDFAAFGEQSDL